MYIFVPLDFKPRYIRDSSEEDRQTTNLQRDALLKNGVDARSIF